MRPAILPFGVSLVLYTSRTGGPDMALSTLIPRIFAAGILCAATLTTGIPVALADNTIACAPGEIVIDGQCHTSASQDNHPSYTGGTGTGTGTHSHGH